MDYDSFSYLANKLIRVNSTDPIDVERQRRTNPDEPPYNNDSDNKKDQCQQQLNNIQPVQSIARTTDSNDITLIRDIPYCTGVNSVPHKHCYDIYYKQSAVDINQPVPIIVTIHGGGYARMYHITYSSSDR